MKSHVNPRSILVLAAGLMTWSSYALPAINPPAGRLAIVADGNSPDPDDIGGTAATLAILRSASLQGKLVHYSHSCDLDPFLSAGSQTITPAQEADRQIVMQESCDGTVSRWGGFPSLTYWNCRTHEAQAVSDLKDAINASSSSDPLWIIEAGEPDIIGYALDAANASACQHVKIITHHPANDDSGDYFTWQQILDYGIEEVRIPDQNTELKVSTNQWLWARDHSDSRITWLWDRGMIAEADPAVGFQHGYFDISDAGMAMYWLTGANVYSGLQTPTVTDFRDLLEDYVDGGLDLDHTFNAALYDIESHPGNDSIIRDAGTHIGYIKNGSWVAYLNFDFNTGIESIDVVATTPNSGSIEVRTDSPTGPLLGTVNITSTGGWGSFQTFSANLSSTIGVKDLYFVFVGGSGGLFNLKSYHINAASVTTSIVEDTDAGLVYSGSWASQSNASDHGGSMRYSNTAGDSVAFTFTGTEVNVGVRKGKYGGLVDIYLDGALVASDVDTYADPQEFQVIVYSSGALASGTHTIELVVTGTKSSASSGTNVMFDFLEVLSGAASVVVGKEYNWDNGAENTYFKQVTDSVSGGILTMTLSAGNNDPYVRMNASNVDGDTYTHARIRVRNNTTGTAWKMYFKPLGGGEGGNSISFTVAADGAWHTYDLDMSADPDWTGTISSIRLDPEGYVAGTVDVDYVQLITAP